MGKEFEIVREVVVEATPEDVFDGLVNGTAAWLWPMEFEPRVGGQAAFGGTVTVWDPPHHMVTRVDGADGWFNQLEEQVEARPDGTTFLRYVHSGIFVDNWDGQYDGANQHTDFYLHTFGQYLRYFTRRRAVYAEATAPAASITPDGFASLHHALGLPAGVTQGDTVRISLPGIDPLDAVVDYLHPHFLGLRTTDGMYRFFGRNAFGAPVGLTMHLFTEHVDQEKTQAAWQAWLDTVYA
jgi:uncharacterized protein YndB with AHSA1/START domain